MKSKKDKGDFNKLNHSIPLNEEEIQKLRAERKQTIALLKKMRSVKNR